MTGLRTNVDRRDIIVSDNGLTLIFILLDVLDPP